MGVLLYKILHLSKQAMKQTKVASYSSGNVGIKPDIHLHFSLIAIENFRIGHAQSGQSNIKERKTIFHSVRY